MICFVIGTPDSGKSALAEELAMKTKDPLRIYLATMKVYDDEGKKRVKKHRKMREGKGFETVEKEYGIAGLCGKIKRPEETTVLLECVSNLVGNEIFENPLRKGIVYGEASEGVKDRGSDDLADEIAAGIRKFSESVHNIVIVTNEFDAAVQETSGSGKLQAKDACDDETVFYIRLLSMVNDRIRLFSDRIYDLRKEIEG